MSNIDQHFEAYSAWRQELFKAVGDFRGWLQSQELADVQVDQRLDQVLSTLRDDKLYVAFVAEFSRGKSELINAIFFAAFGQRVLPSSAGRTTMCPTELMYDKGSAPCVRLLPIETRAGGTTVSELKGFQEERTTIPLDPSESGHQRPSRHSVHHQSSFTACTASRLAAARPASQAVSVPAATTAAHRVSSRPQGRASSMVQ